MPCPPPVTIATLSFSPRTRCLLVLHSMILISALSASSTSAREKRQNPPLRSGYAQRLERAIHHDAAQSRNVMDEKSEAKACVKISHHGTPSKPMRPRAPK